MGPALQFDGGSFCRSINSWLFARTHTRRTDKPSNSSQHCVRHAQPCKREPVPRGHARAVHSGSTPIMCVFRAIQAAGTACALSVRKHSLRKLKFKQAAREFHPCVPAWPAAGRRAESAARATCYDAFSSHAEHSHCCPPSHALRKTGRIPVRWPALRNNA
jgi:hypothetical protein